MRSTHRVDPQQASRSARATSGDALSIRDGGSMNSQAADPAVREYVQAEVRHRARGVHCPGKEMPMIRAEFRLRKDCRPRGGHESGERCAWQQAAVD